MTDHKLTDDKIIKALNEADGLNEVSLYCADSKGENPSAIKMPDIVDLINRQKAEIERLKDKVKRLQESVRLMLNYDDGDERIKAEAIKEFAERLKSKLDISACGYSTEEIISNVEDTIDNLVEEMENET